MSLLVVGSIGLDTVETPDAKRENVLGGSAIYFSVAASLFTQVDLVGVVGTDFPPEHRAMLEARGIGLAGLEVAQGQTFRWSGRYHANLVDRDTLQTDLNVFGSFDPKVPAAARKSEFLFLANGVPAVQRRTLAQMQARPKFVAADTMDLWIRTAKDELLALLKDTDALILNDSEARELTSERSLPRAARAVQQLGPSTVIIKKGEHGAMMVANADCFVLPAYPLERVVDPTGAGDSFAGGFMGYLAATRRTSITALRRALVYGTVVASFTCQGFSLDALLRISRAEVDARCQELVRMTRVSA